MQRELDSADRVDLLCAFVRWHGLRAGVVELVDDDHAKSSLTMLAETADYWRHLVGVLQVGAVEAAAVHDARVAALCLAHGITELWSVDRDFGRFPDLRVVNPLGRRR